MDDGFQMWSQKRGKRNNSRKGWSKRKGRYVVKFYDRTKGKEGENVENSMRRKNTFLMDAIVFMWGQVYSKNVLFVKIKNERENNLWLNNHFFNLCGKIKSSK